MRIAFTNATIWTAAGDPLEGASLLIDGGKVVAVGPEVDTDGAEVVDCSGKVITPGFIDCHSHAGVSGEGVMGDGDVNEMSEPIAPHVRMLDAIHPEDLGFADARRGGVTTMGITHGSALAIGGQVAATKTAGTVADDMVIREPAGLKMALGENPKRVGERGKRAPMTRGGTAFLARKAFT
ncbi:MAG: amidohydrolase, partial [Acidimicrobiia bacterium]|nr:amidohydrolase [Acidimicrobiia bacterium]